MSLRGKNLAERLRKFNHDVISFVEQCDDSGWRKVCAWEEWTVGVTARHIGAGHYEVVGMAQAIVAGEKLPDLTMDQITEMANAHAREHADCTRAEVLKILRKNGAALIDFVNSLKDADLDRTAFLTLIGGDVTTQTFLETVVLQSGGEHLASMKAAIGA